jgi:hypothetical protein
MQGSELCSSYKSFESVTERVLHIGLRLRNLP